MASTELAKYLSRPSVIQDIAWTQVAGTYDQSFNPWFEYFNTTEIKKKLDNYAYISCNLHVKVVLNASPFFYGCLNMSYTPMLALQTNQNNSVAGLDTNSLNYRSQTPCVYMYPQTCQGGEMILPFYFTKNWLSVSTAADFNNMGTIFLKSFANLRSANGVATSIVSGRVFAWAEDVRLCGATNTLALQCIPEPDTDNDMDFEMLGYEVYQLIDRYTSTLNPIELEIITKFRMLNHRKQAYFLDEISKMTSIRKMNIQSEYKMDGPISAPASTIASIAGSLTAAPIIGPYAKATEMVSKAVGRAASIFGYTNVPQIDDVKPLKSMVFHSFSSAEIGQPVEKLSLDPKNELTIDNSVVGIGGQDEHLISNICGREAFFMTMTWTQVQTNDTNIGVYAVGPYYITNLLDANSIQRIQQTPMSRIASIFKYWRGDIIFRFRIVCSRFHKGRLLFQWDPRVNNQGVFVDTHVVISKIVDITEEVDVEMRIPYMALAPFLATPIGLDPTNLNKRYWGGATINDSGSTLAHNGVLTVKVFTQLSAPADGSDISIIVTARGAENLEFASLLDAPQTTSQFNVQSSPEVDYGAPELVAFGDNTKKIDNKDYLIANGERILSIRQILRRSEYSRGVVLPSDTTNQFKYVQLNHSPIPLYRGFDPNGINSATRPIAGGPGPYNFVNTLLYNWLAPMYVTYRGSHIWHYNIVSTAPVGNACASRNPRAITAANYLITTDLATGVSVNVAALYNAINMPTGGAGFSVTNQNTQAGVSVLYPYYGVNRCRFTNPGYATLGSTNEGSYQENCRLTLSVAPVANTTQSASTLIQLYHSIGTDFSFQFFLAVPTLFVIVNPTPT